MLATSPSAEAATTASSVDGSRQHLAQSISDLLREYHHAKSLSLVDRVDTITDSLIAEDKRHSDGSKNSTDGWSVPCWMSGQTVPPPAAVAALDQHTLAPLPPAQPPPLALPPPLAVDEHFACELVSTDVSFGALREAISDGAEPAAKSTRRRPTHPLAHPILQSLPARDDPTPRILLMTPRDGDTAGSPTSSSTESMNGCTSASERTQCVPTRQERRWGELRLVMRSHAVHKVLNEGTEHQEYIISNRKHFTVRLCLAGALDGLPAANALDLRATLLFEDGSEVEPLERERSSSHEAPLREAPLLLGDTRATTCNGEVSMRLKMGAETLSTRLGRRRFRIRIEPVEESLREGYPMLSVVSAPLWSISKPERCIEAVQKKVERLGGDSPREQVEGARAANRTESKL